MTNSLFSNNPNQNNNPEQFAIDFCSSLECAERMDREHDLILLLLKKIKTVPIVKIDKKIYFSYSLFVEESNTYFNNRLNAKLRKSKNAKAAYKNRKARELKLTGDIQKNDDKDDQDELATTNLTY